MVMEAYPSPQCVGREFVLQYYTLLNKAPTHLHRFYNNLSSFVHGGLDSNRESSPAIGQKQIHQKIQALNFQDCHAKINQVDSQSTLGNGVVVQVSGELSNAGHPMRRFTQTFVLAAQAPTRYYVHNDIFRYQDYGYGDDEEEEGESESNINENSEREPDENSIRQEVDKEDQLLGNKISHIDQHVQNQPPAMTQQQIYYAIPPQPQIHQIMQQVTINGSVHEDTSVISQPALQQPSSIPQQPQYVSEQSQQEHFSPENEKDTQLSVKSESHNISGDSNEVSNADKITYTASSESEINQISSQNSINSAPKTYANLVKSLPSVGSTSPQISKPSSLSPPPTQNIRVDERVTTHQQTAGPSHSSSAMPLNQQVHRMSGIPQQHSQQYAQRLPRTSGPMQRDGERRTGRPGGYTDAHQLFLGNLPHNASENDLRQVFERYGRVADLRVHSKQNDRTKGLQSQNNTRVPNYGFITFEDSTVVSKVLADLPIYFPDENGQKLNVEEKKVRPREVSGRPNTNDGNLRPMGSAHQQRGPGNPGGIIRGGQHGMRGRGGFNRSGEGGRGGIRQSGINSTNQTYQNRR